MPNVNRLKFAELLLDDTPNEVDFACQANTWNVTNDTEDGEKGFTYCYDPDGATHPNEGEYREEAEPDYKLAGKMLSDWGPTGISRWAARHDGETVTFRLHSYPDNPTQHHWWEGQVKVKAFSAGGEARTTEKHEFAWPIIGKPELFYETGLESGSN